MSEMKTADVATPPPPATQPKKSKSKPSPIDNKRVRGWCFTLNNYTPDDVKAAKALEHEFEYIVFGKEHGEQKDTPHLQGFVHANNARRGSAMRKLFNDRAHWEPQSGTFLEAAMYCKKGTQPHTEWLTFKPEGWKGPNFGKDADIFEAGEACEQGERSDLEKVCKMIIEGHSLDDVATEAPSVFVRNVKGLAALRATRFTDRDPNKPPQVIWRWGLAGVGKTRKPIEAHKSYFIKDGTMWWDGYEQQEAIIVDDFDGKWPYRDFLRFLDRYPYQGQFKGGYVSVNSPFIYITCEHPPEFFFGLNAGVGRPDGSAPSQNELDQVLRRITRIEHVVRADNAPPPTGPERVEVTS
nr:putative replication associated protein [Crucivirus sp.]